MRPDDASARQIRAASPGTSAWVAANAGSGKTRVLTDRVARLLLHGVQPQHILCLTYTRAAATEMQNRLFRLLGSWAMKPDAELAPALQALGEDGPLPAEALARARRLFARALETPGGLRIQTIHSFCASLLRRFPLEAGVPPAFRELDDRLAAQLRSAVLEEMAETAAPDLIAELALVYTGDDLTALATEVVSQRAGFTRPLSRAQAYDLFGLSQNLTPQSLLDDVFLGNEAALVTALAPVLRAAKDTDRKLADQLASLSLDAPTLGTLADLESLFLYGETAKAAHTAKTDRLPTKDCRAALGDLLPPLQDWMGRVESARPQRLAFGAAQRTALLHRFAAAFLPRYEAAKAARGLLDFDDLIQRAHALLTDRALAAWVLFRLDGGIDHILVDEAQDTSPDQWRIIELLTAEFTAGQGARDEARTLFVVGDKKQSIYSFQGADVAAFDRKQVQFGDAFRSVDQPFQQVELEYSFRSSPAVLQLVDATFGTRFPAAVGSQMRHIAFKSAMPGRVDLWPLIEPTKNEADEEWENPVDLVSETHHSARLAAQIAREIAQMVASGQQIPVDPSESPSGFRPVQPGDFLILVQRRATIFAEIIRACKQAGLPIAGADRLKLAEELAVRDLTALLSFLATEEDDLSLATVLRSPLCDLSEDDLYRLAHGRKGSLWDVLRQSPHHAAHRMLTDLRNLTDFLRPYELLERALIRHDGRRRLVARLGPEAEDGIDALLHQALSHEQVDVPSLTGFLIWLESGEVEIKRQADSAGNRIRVMTVHGAKGLEAPIVILPDTADRDPRDRGEVYRLPDGPGLWKTAAADSPAIIATLREDRRRRQAEEGLRLLYVALTRARSWLIVAGAGEAKTERKDGPRDPLDWAWHLHVRQAMQGLGTMPLTEGRLRFQTGDWPAAQPVPASAAVAPLASLPDWVASPAPALTRAADPLSPSNLGGDKILPGEGLGLSEAQAKARGTALHLLLQHLPDHPPQDWPLLAERLLPEAALRSDTLPEATRLLSAADLAPLFGPDSLAEVAISGLFQGNALYGSIDRLLIRPDHILAVDFKSNAVVPDHATHVPEGLLRQMGAYAAALAPLWPGREIRTAILWTRTARLMPLPPNLVSQALGRVTLP